MEKLQYVIEDKTIAELLGVQNFSTDESAILELVKNAYDARASFVKLIFEEDKLTIIDDGTGMNIDDIKLKWMHVGKSTKDYKTVLENNQVRVLAGSKGVGRFALARLGEAAYVISKKDGCTGVIWETDWSSSSVSMDEGLHDTGTKILIKDLRAKWNKKKVENLVLFLSKTYNNNVMRIFVSHPDINTEIAPYITELIPGVNCLAKINLNYDSANQSLTTEVVSDEFLDSADKYCEDIDLKYFFQSINVFDELKTNDKWELSEEELRNDLLRLGDFSAEFSFTISPSKADVEKFLYKHYTLPRESLKGVILYRNAFSISSYEGKKDWLGFGKRSRKSPAAATHPTGSWRVRENQMAGKVEIDKQRNGVLQDLSNRQGLDENIFYELFVEIVLAGIKGFERYRQNIIRHINVKNVPVEEKPAPVSDKIVSNPSSAASLSKEETMQLAAEIKAYQRAHTEAQRERDDVETRYKYDVRILNVLATVGLKASSIAHEMRNDRNSVADNIDNIISALKKFDMWDELCSPEHTEKSYQNVPYLLETNKQVSSKLLAFMNTMLSEIEKKQFEPSWQSVNDIIQRIKKNWEDDYAWISISINMDDDICFMISEDYLQVIFDNLILNSIQQNESLNHLDISIGVALSGSVLSFSYADSGKGLDKKYLKNPEKILEVHETTRKKGHGLGMWIVNNTVTMSGGEIAKISGNDGFYIEFTIGGLR